MVSRLDRVYYEDELRYLEEESAVFAERHPEIARFLGLQGRDPALRDPHAERIIESFAFMMGKLRRFLDAQFPELVHSLYYMLYPQYLRPLPAKTLVQFHSKENMLDKPLPLARGTELYAEGLGPGGQTYTFTTCWDLLIQPLVLKKVYIDPEADSDYNLSAELSVEAGAQAQDCEWDQVEFAIHGDPSTIYELFHKLSGQLTKVTLKGIKGVELEVVWSGFESSHNYDEEDTGRFGNLHYLRDYFDYPHRFFFFRLKGLDRVFEKQDDLEAVQVDFHFSRPFATGFRVQNDNLRLNCCVAQNLFVHDCEPVKVDGVRLEYSVDPQAERQDMEVHSIMQVLASEGQKTETVRPFYQFDRHNVDTDQQWFYTLRREPAMDHGWNCHMRFIDLNHDGTGALANQVISTLARCTNRHFAQHLKLGQLDGLSRDVPETVSVTNITPASPSLWPALHSKGEWDFLAHLSLDYSEIDDLETLRCLLNLYHYSGNEAGKRKIKGIRSAETKRDFVIRQGCCILGRRLTLELDSAYYPAGGDIVLFNRVFGHFLKAYCPINSFLGLKVQDMVTKESFDYTVWG